MNILYFYQYFTTPNGSYSTRVYEFTKIWKEQGHDITVITSVYEKSDLRTNKFIETKFFDGVRVKIINIRIDNKQNFLKRIFTFFLYACISSYFALILKADVVISSSGPITTGLPGILSKIIRKKKFVFEVRDLWPDGAIALGVIKNRFVIKLAYWFEKLCYQKSDIIIALSDGIKDFISQKKVADKIIVITNAADNLLFGQHKQDYKLPNFLLNKEIAIYSGNIGEVNNSELLFEAAKELHKVGRQDILILLIGDGQLKEKLMSDIDQCGLKNIRILEKIPKHQLVHYLQSSFVSLVPLKAIPLLDTSSPNKLFDSLASGIPLIQTSNGWIKNLLEEFHCGITVSAENAKELANACILLADNKNLAEEMGRNARALAINKFDKRILALNMLEAIKKI